MDKPNQVVVDLTFDALEHAMDSVVGTNGPLIPFAIIEAANGERSLVRFTTGSGPEEARLHARKHVAESKDCVRYAVAAEGNAIDNGQRTLCIMVESGQRDEPNGFSFVQRFSSTPNCRFAERLRNPQVIGLPAILK